MFDLESKSSSSDDKRGRTKTIRIAYTEEPCFNSDSDDYSSESSTSASVFTPTTSSGSSGRSLLEQLENEREKERFYGYYPIWRNMSLSDGVKMNTLEYFWDVNIFQLFNFMMTHLLVQSPEDPVSFLVDLIDRCIRYREEGDEPPLVFEDAHINSVYNALDPLNEGSISYSQYLAGMRTLGLTEFNIIPEGMEDDKVISKDVFLGEAKRALIKQLNIIIGKGKPPSSKDGVEAVIDYEHCDLIPKGIHKLQ